MTPKEIHDRLKARCGDKVLGCVETPVEPYVTVAREGLCAVGLALRDEPDLRFDFLASVAGVDYGDRLAAVYHLLSTRLRQRLVLRVDVAKTDAVIPSVAQIWPAAGWHEREAWDLLGIKFDGHPDLRRILLPDDWEGHPLRKDFVFPKEYRGITLE